MKRKNRKRTIIGARSLDQYETTGQVYIPYINYIYKNAVKFKNL